MTEPLTLLNRQRLRQYVRSTLYREPERGIPLPALRLLTLRRTGIEEADIYTAHPGADDTRHRSANSVVDTQTMDPATGLYKALGIGMGVGDATSAQAVALVDHDWRNYLKAELHGSHVVEVVFEHRTVGVAVTHLSPDDQQALYDLATCSVKMAARKRGASPQSTRRLTVRALMALLTCMRVG